MACHAPLGQLHLILSDPGVVGSWRVQSPGMLSCRLCINILCFYTYCFITRAPPPLLREIRVHRSQKEGRHSCWNQGENKARLFLWCESLAGLALFSRDAAFCFSGRWVTLTPWIIQAPPPQRVHAQQGRGGRPADRQHWFEFMDLQLWNWFRVWFCWNQMILCI